MKKKPLKKITGSIKKFNGLKGKTIKNIKQRKHSKYDDDCYLDVEFEDGTKCTIWGGYGGYTWKSYDEYKALIGLAPFGWEDGDDIGGRYFSSSEEQK